MMYSKECKTSCDFFQMTILFIFSNNFNITELARFYSTLASLIDLIHLLVVKISNGNLQYLFLQNLQFTRVVNFVFIFFFTTVSFNVS